ncbi:MAG: methionyl-tRNA formyltransferase [Patescibacteria group bacterium]
MKEGVNKKLNFVFWGTPDFAVYILLELKEAGYLPSLVVTTRDMKIGRGNKFDSPPVKKWADKEGIPVLQPETIDELFLDILRKEKYDVFILTAYGKMLPKKLLAIPKHGILNTHPSLLPKLRGPSPVRSAILNDERGTGATVIVLDEKMDHGPIVAQEGIEIKEEDWPPLLPVLEEMLFRKGGKLLVKILEDYVDGKIAPVPQDESKATYCKKIKKEDGLVDLEKDSGRDIYKKYCAFYGWPGIYFMKNGKRIKITKAKLEDGKFVVEKIIPENGKEMDYKD